MAEVLENSSKLRISSPVNRPPVPQQQQQQPQNFQQQPQNNRPPAQFQQQNPNQQNFNQQQQQVRGPNIQQQRPQQPQQQQQQQPQIIPNDSNGGQNADDDDDDVVMGKAITPSQSRTSSALSNRTFDNEIKSQSNQPNANTPNRGPLPQGDNDSGVDETTQEKDRNGPASPSSPLKSPSKIPSYQPRPSSITPKSRSRSTSKQRLSLKASPDSPAEPSIKKIPMNKIEVGFAPSPNLKQVRSKIGSLDNASHKPGGGQVKIESRKVDIKAAPRIEAKNASYVSKGGDKKILSTKLTWNAKSKIGSLDNATHKPGGGDKKIIEIKTDFSKAKPKVGSKDNVGHNPGGGDVKILSQKIDIKAESKVGSLDNMKHKPGGGDKKIFDDKEYLKQIDHPIQLSPQPQMFSSGYWRSKPYTLSTSLSLPNECIVMSVCSPAKKIRRIIQYSGRALHPKPFRTY
ncbi:unnamed protein product [Diamesa hyperborea]